MVLHISRVFHPQSSVLFRDQSFLPCLAKFVAFLVENPWKRSPAGKRAQSAVSNNRINSNIGVDFPGVFQISNQNTYAPFIDFPGSFRVSLHDSSLRSGSVPLWSRTRAHSKGGRLRNSTLSCDGTKCWIPLPTEEYGQRPLFCRYRSFSHVDVFFDQRTLQSQYQVLSWTRSSELWSLKNVAFDIQRSNFK